MFLQKAVSERTQKQLHLWAVSTCVSLVPSMFVVLHRAVGDRRAALSASSARGTRYARTVRLSHHSFLFAMSSATEQKMSWGHKFRRGRVRMFAEPEAGASANMCKYVQMVKQPMRMYFGVPRICVNKPSSFLYGFVCLQ